MAAARADTLSYVRAIRVIAIVLAVAGFAAAAFFVGRNIGLDHDHPHEPTASIEPSIEAPAMPAPAADVVVTTAAGVELAEVERLLDQRLRRYVSRAELDELLAGLLSALEADLQEVLDGMAVEISQHRH